MPAGQDLKSTQLPVRLDRRFFADDEILRKELELVFRPSWQLIAFESELPDPGDYVVRRMGLDSVIVTHDVIVTRDEQGAIAILLSSCNHRGTQLCRATFGNAAHFRCSYHGWTYGNDGKLIGVPHLRTAYPATFDKSLYGLRRARVTVYRGFVFATWQADGPSSSKVKCNF
jgi:phenylpropionate dioxygenase-like ring-hydroxylating dioxygenase large terminal subunit